MGKWKIQLDYAGVGQLLKSQEMADLCSGIGKNIQEKCGGVGTAGAEEFKVETKNAGSRIVTTVSTDTPHAYYSNLKHNTLAKALGSAKK